MLWKAGKVDWPPSGEASLKTETPGSVSEQDLFTNVSEGAWEWDIAAGLVELSPGAIAMLGLDSTRGPLSDAEFLSLIHPDDRPTHVNAIRRCLKGESELYRAEVRLVLASDAEIRLINRGVLQRGSDGRAWKMSGSMDNVTQRRKLERALKHTVSAVSGQAGKAFFQSLVEFLSLALECELALVGEWHEPSGSVRTTAVWRDGQISENFVYQLSVSPCRNVVGESLCIYPRDVWRLFPEDKAVADARIEGYAGAPLFDSRGQSIGLIAVLFRKPIVECELCDNLLRIFTGRASAELERAESARKLSISEQLFRDYANSSSEHFWEMDKQFRFCQIGEWVSRNAGFRQSQILGKTRWEIASADPESPKWREHIESLKRHEPFSNFRYTVTNEGGTVTHLSVTGVPIFDDTGGFTGYRGTASNITTAVEAEMDKQEAEERLHMALEAAHLFAWDWKIDSPETLWHQQQERLLGPKPTEGFGDFKGMILAEDLPGFLQAGQKCIENGGRYHSEFRIHTTDGRIKWLSAKGMLVRDSAGEPARIIGITQDITASRDMEDRLRLSATVFETSEAILITDTKGVILNANSGFEKVSGYRRNELIGKNAGVLRSGYHDRDFYQAFWSELIQNGRWQGELRVRRRSGEIAPLWVTINAVVNDAGDTTHYVATYIDLTERRRAERHISRLSNFDALTELPNRKMFSEALSLALDEMEQSGRGGGVLLLDLDGFRTINESLGYHAGDMVLRTVAGVLRQAVNGDDVVARIGPDEFAVLIVDSGSDPVQGLGYLRSMANRIMNAISRPLAMADRELYLSCSIGINHFSEPGESNAEEILAHSEIAMHQARQEGYSSSRVYRPNMKHHSEFRLRMQSLLSSALQTGRLVTFFQKQVNDRGGVAGAEALARLKLTSGEIVSPRDFISVAEETGLIVPLGNTVMEQSLATMAGWRSEMNTPPGFIAVNVSPRQFLRDAFTQSILQALRKYEVPGTCLEIEITEHLLVADFERVAKVMRELRQEGVRFAIDDFGVGHSSMTYLKRLPIDKLKIDRSFIDGLGRDESSDAIVDAIISIGEVLGLEVVAEGVETEQTYNMLRDRGCQLFQGYHFGKTLDINRFNAEL